MDNLHHIEVARRRRAAKAKMLAALESGQVQATDVVLRPPGPLKTTDLWVVLLACPRIGRVKARKICEDARVFPNVPLGELSKPQRQAVADLLPR
jgi:hypothetical protein